MQRLEASGAVRPIYKLLRVKGLTEHNGYDEPHDSEYTSLQIPTYTCVVCVTQCTSKSTDLTEIHTPLYAANLVHKNLSL